jgi:hypothetical protein
MASQSVWKSFFNNWPAGIPHRGVLVNSLNEPMPFKNFMISDDVLLLERTNVDPLGARFILLSFDAINSVKLIDPVKDTLFTAAGFLGKFEKN